MGQVDQEVGRCWLGDGFEVEGKGDEEGHNMEEGLTRLAIYREIGGSKDKGEENIIIR